MAACVQHGCREWVSARGPPRWSPRAWRSLAISLSLTSAFDSTLMTAAVTGRKSGFSNATLQVPATAVPGEPDGDLFPGGHDVLDRQVHAGGRVGGHMRLEGGQAVEVAEAAVVPGQVLGHQPVDRPQVA